MKKVLSVLLAAMLLLTAASPALADGPDGPPNGFTGKTVILYTGNLRGDVDIYPQIAHVKKDLQSNGADVILVDAGNFLQGSAVANFDRGETIYALMDAAGYDAAAMGLAEFGYVDATTGYPYHGNVNRYYTQAMLQDGTEEISYNRDAKGEKPAVLPAREGASFQTVSANVAPHDCYSFAPVADVTTEGGLTVRFVGITDPAVAGLVQDGYVTVTEPAVPLDLGADLTVTLSNAPGEDASGSGLLIQAPTGGEPVIGALLIDNETLDITEMSFVLDAADPDAAALAEQSKAQDIKVLGRSEVILEGRDSANRNRETNLGDLTCDALLWYAETYIDGIDSSYPIAAIQNGGNCDSFLYTGDITEVDLLEALPFSPMGIGVLQVTGQQLLETLEAGSQRPNCAGFVQTAGIKYAVDPFADYDAGEAYGKFYMCDSINRVTIAEVGGQPFDPAAVYNLVADNFVLNGNDTYYTLKAAKDAGAAYVNNGNGVKTRDAVAMYIDEVLGGVLDARYAARPAYDGQPRVLVQHFRDVPALSWYADCALWAVENGVTAGTGEDCFSPELTLDRAQAVTFLWNLAGRPVVNYAMRFSDVSPDAWYAEAVRWAVSQGIASGAGEGTFAPASPCTRDMLAVFLWNAAGKPEVSGELSLAYSDIESGAYYETAARWAVENGIIVGGGDGRFDPQGTVDRSQAVRMLYQYAGPADRT